MSKKITALPRKSLGYSEDLIAVANKAVDSGDIWDGIFAIDSEDVNYSIGGISKNGQYILVGGWDWRLYVSNDYGKTFTEVQPAGDFDKDWMGASISGDGRVMVAVVNDGRLYISIDYGVNWSEKRPNGDSSFYYSSCCCNYDGSVIITNIWGGRVWMSIDSGENWSEIRPNGDSDQNWQICDCDSDGSVIFCGEGYGRLYISTDSGANWSEVQPNGAYDGSWWGCALSSDGSIVYVCDNGGRVYKSINSGVAWSEIQPIGAVDKSWVSVSCSDDGSIVFVVGYQDYPYLSINSGSTFTRQNLIASTYQTWQLCDCDTDGSHLLALCGVYGAFYTSSTLATKRMKLSDLKIALNLWPIGSVFISVVSTNPTQLLGFGSWLAFGAGRVLVSRNASDPDFDTAEETGGNKTQTPSAHAGTAVGNHAAKNTDSANAGATQRGSTASTLTLANHYHNISQYTHTVTQPSAHDALSVVQPYIVVYMWKRVG